MKQFFIDFQSEVISSLIVIGVLLIIKFVTSKTLKKVGRISNLNPMRTKLILRFVSYAFTAISIGALLLIWGIKIKDLGLIMSSVFAVIGVALFAQWSILSNVTAGIILFLSFPFKIGDRIQITDKEMEYEGTFIIEDIKAYHMHLRKDTGELMTYPNNMIMQKAITLVK